MGKKTYRGRGNTYNWNQTTNNTRKGDVIIYLDAWAVLGLSIIGFGLFIGYHAFMNLLFLLEKAFNETGEKIRSITRIVTDPELLPYFVAISGIIGLIFICLVYLMKRFPFVVNSIKNFFKNEQDVEW